MQILEDKPPYVSFEVRSVEDRDATIRTGIYSAKDVNYAIITPSGSKDRVERVADDWLQHITDESRRQRFNPQWVEYYKLMYKNWKEGLEIPLSGRPLRDWPGLSPSQLRMLQEIHILTIEDLRDATEEALQHMGPGARALKQRAAAFLEASVDHGQIAEEVNALRVRNDELATQNASLEAQVQALAKRLEKLEPQAKESTK